jgi:hypothetical protein
MYGLRSGVGGSGFGVRLEVGFCTGSDAAGIEDVAAGISAVDESRVGKTDAVEA